MALQSLDHSWIIACTMMPLLLHLATMTSLVTTFVNFVTLYCPSLTTTTALFPVSSTLLYSRYTTFQPSLLLLMKIPAYFRRISLLLVILIWDTSLYYVDPPKERISLNSTRSYKQHGVLHQTHPLRWKIISGYLLGANTNRAMNSFHPGVVAYSHLAHAVYRTHVMQTSMDIAFKLLHDSHICRKEEYITLFTQDVPQGMLLYHC